jgi:hypothetical protein
MYTTKPIQGLGTQGVSQSPQARRATVSAWKTVPETGGGGGLQVAVECRLCIHVQPRSHTGQHLKTQHTHARATGNMTGVTERVRCKPR